MSGAAVGAGALGTLGSLTAKLAFDPALLLNSCLQLGLGTPRLCELSFFFGLLSRVRMLRMLAVGVWATSQVYMWRLHSRALAATSSAHALVLNSATNFFLSGLVGVVLLGEAHSLLWWLGLSLVVLGSSVIHQGQPTPKPPPPVLVQPPSSPTIELDESSGSENSLSSDSVDWD